MKKDRNICGSRNSQSDGTGYLVEITEHLDLTGELPIIALFMANVPGKTPRFTRIS